MTMWHKITSAMLALLVSATLAVAIQPGTTGTDKVLQRSGFRSAVLIQRNATATATGGAATLNQAGSGIVTTESLTTAAGSDYTLTLTNNMIGAADVVLASVQYGTSTTGSPYVARVTPAAGSVVIIVRNGQSSVDAVLNGTLKISFLVVKQSANGSD